MSLVTYRRVDLQIWHEVFASVQANSLIRLLVTLIKSPLSAKPFVSRWLSAMDILEINLLVSSPEVIEATLH